MDNTNKIIIAPKANTGVFGIELNGAGVTSVIEQLRCIVRNYKGSQKERLAAQSLGNKFQHHLSSTNKVRARGDIGIVPGDLALAARRAQGDMLPAARRTQGDMLPAARRAQGDMDMCSGDLALVDLIEGIPRMTDSWDMVRAIRGSVHNCGDYALAIP